MPRFLLFPVFFPMLAGLFAYWIGRWQEKARDMFILSATAMELLLVLVIWTNPELANASVNIEGFCILGIQFQAGSFHTLMALLTAAGWLAGSVYCREYMVHVKKQNRFYFFWMMTLGATVGVFLSADFFTTFLFFEVLSFASFVLVIQTEEQKARIDVMRAKASLNEEEETADDGFLDALAGSAAGDWSDEEN